MQQAIFFEASDPIALVQLHRARLVTIVRVIEREEKYLEQPTSAAPLLFDKAVTGRINFTRTFASGNCEENFFSALRLESR